MNNLYLILVHPDDGRFKSNNEEINCFEQTTGVKICRYTTDFNNSLPKKFEIIQWMIQNDIRFYQIKSLRNFCIDEINHDSMYAFCSKVDHGDTEKFFLTEEDATKFKLRWG